MPQVLLYSCLFLDSSGPPEAGGPQATLRASVPPCFALSVASANSSPLAPRPPLSSISASSALLYLRGLAPGTYAPGAHMMITIKQRISSALNSVPLRPAPTTNQPTRPWIR